MSLKFRPSCGLSNLLDSGLAFLFHNLKIRFRISTITSINVYLHEWRDAHANKRLYKVEVNFHSLDYIVLKKMFVDFVHHLFSQSLTRVLINGGSKGSELA